MEDFVSEVSARIECASGAGFADDVKGYEYDCADDNPSQHVSSPIIVVRGCDGRNGS
jgi:hypothetical protein